MILPRKIAGGETAKHVLRRADPGETDVDTELYSLLRTPSSSLIEWGLGVDQYFISLRIMALVLFIAGLIHLPNLIFYRSGEYCSADKSGISISLKGSALCTETEWVVCTDCFQSKWLSLEEQARFADATNPITNEAVTLIQRFACKGGRLPQGIVNWACFFFLVIAMYLIHIYLSAREIRFDEDK